MSCRERTAQPPRPCARRTSIAPGRGSSGTGATLRIPLRCGGGVPRRRAVRVQRARAQRGAPDRGVREAGGDDGATRVVDIAPVFTVDDGHVLRNEVRRRLNADELRRAYGDAIRRVNRAGEVGAPTVRELVGLVAANAAKGADYFAGYPDDYRCLIRIKGASTGIEVAKRGAHVMATETDGALSDARPYDVVYRTRALYLRQSLVTPYGHEVLFVGSRGIFASFRVGSVGPGVHREMMTMARP